MAEPIPEKEIEGAYELPEGWVWATIGDACEINPKSSNLSDLDQSLPTTFVPMSAVDQIEGVIETPEVLSLGTARKGHTHFIENDVIFAKITPCMENGKVAIAKNLVNGLGFGSTEFHVIRSPKGVIPKFVFYFVRQEFFRKEASVHFTSTVGQMRVPKAFMMDAPFPLPPLAEQRRIVAKLEALLAQVNAAKDHLAAVPPIIKRFRQSVLAAACSGRLTEDWRREHPDEEPASELLKKIREERIRRYAEECQKAKAEGERKPKKPKNIEPQEVGTEWLPELPEGWAWTRLENCVDILDGQRIPVNSKEREKRKGDIPYYGATGRVGWIDDYIFDGELLLVGEDGAPFFDKTKHVAYIINGKSWVNNHAHVLRAIKEITSNRFLCNYLNLFDYQGFVKGTTRLKLNQGSMKNIPTPLPPLSEQRAIVNQIETLFHRTSEVGERVAAATSHADRLTQSILAKAFRGELVPQDPDDEPASVLLERIRKERTELKKKKKPQKRRSKTI